MSKVEQILKSRFTRKSKGELRFKVYLGVVLLLLISLFFLYSVYYQKKYISVGVLLSLSGPMSVSEKPLLDSYQLAIEEINKAGGINGTYIRTLVRDTESNWSKAAIEAEKLIQEDHVSVLFGCWTSACRIKVKKVVEKHNHLLVYPLQYEGLEQSPNIFYTGATPNQQIIPAINWLLQHRKEKFFIVGSEYIFPRVSATIIKDLLKFRKAKFVGESFVPLGQMEFSEAVSMIVKAKPDIIVNLINGLDNQAFFSQLREAGIKSKDIPVISFSIGEAELTNMKMPEIDGDYVAWNYFQTIEHHENEKFKRMVHKKIGPDKPIGDPFVSAYIGVKMWAAAYSDTISGDLDLIRSDLSLENIISPDGSIVSADAKSNHCWKTVYIGQITQRNTIKVVWTSGKPIRPEPFPLYRTRRYWSNLLIKYRSGG